MAADKTESSATASIRRVSTRVDAHAARAAMACRNTPRCWSRWARWSNARAFIASSTACRSCIGAIPDLHYLIVGGASPEGDMRTELDAQVARAGSRPSACISSGRLPPDELKWPLSAADVFVLATRNEGWANVFLEAMACGLPVVTTDVGGNAEVVCRDELGSVVPFGDAARPAARARGGALTRTGTVQAILAYAEDNAWECAGRSCWRKNFASIVNPWRRRAQLRACRHT